MKVLVEVVHPADVLFFRRPLLMLQARGDEVLIASRHKDVTVDLLDAFGLAHLPLSRAGDGLAGLGAELMERDWALWRAVRLFRPDVMVGFGGLAISHVGMLAGVPAIAFYDSENATLQTRLTWPFVDHLYVPECYLGPVPESRTTRVPGTKDLSFFHPSAFWPSIEIAMENGLDPHRENFFVRVVSWRAGHDIGKRGWSEALLAEVVDLLSARGRVHISSETPLPRRFAHALYTGSPLEVHHLLAHCRLYVGESATMASEAVTVGTPAIYCGHDFPCYTLAMEQAGLLRNVPVAEGERLGDEIRATLAQPSDAFDRARAAWLDNCPDWAEIVVEAIDRHAGAGRRNRGVKADDKRAA